MARILLVGTATLDLVFELDHFPGPDEEMRARSLRTCRGGNAANTAVVLARLGHEVEFFGALADAAETAVIERDFQAHGVTYDHCPRLPGRPPTSSIYLSGANRSIVHYRDLPELAFEHFHAIDPAAYDFVHFECRNVAVIEQVLHAFRTQAPGIRLSLELEKPRAGMEALYALPDVLICSRGFAEHHQFAEPAAFLEWLRGKSPQASLVLGWGEAGAYGGASGGSVCHVLAMRPNMVVDTLGAGDTFNAGLLDKLAGGCSLEEALSHAAELAARKCAVHGFNF
jgi:ketohexokinase